MPQSNVTTSARASSVRFVSLLTALMGLVNVLSAATPGLHDRLAILRQLLPLEVRYGSHLASVLSGFALLMLARHLWRRKRAAWSLTVVILLVSAFSHLLKGLDFEEAAFAVGLAAWLLRLRSAFHARSDRPSVRYGLWVLCAALAFTFLYGVAGLALLDRHFRVDFYPMDAARAVWVMLTQFDDPAPITPFGRYFADSIYAVAACTMAYALLALARPVLVREPASVDERAHAARIVHAYGASTVAWFALMDDKSYFFSPGGSVAAFVVSRRVCVVLGDMIGPPEDASDALSAFLSFCAQSDWQPAFLSTEPETLAMYASAGLHALCVGQEAIVDLGAWTLAGGRMKDIRGRIGRLQKRGQTCEYSAPPQSDAFLEELGEVSDAWLDMAGGVELRFINGSFSEDYIRACPVMAVRDERGQVTAFANLYSEFCRNEATIDLMRRRASVENGTMEFLFASLFEWAKGAGYETFNLGVSPLAGIGHSSSDPATERALCYIFEHSQRFYNFKGLYGFKSKFHPHWSPRYVIYPGPASLFAVVMAVIRLQTGGNYLWRWMRGRGSASAPRMPQEAPLMPEHHTDDAVPV